MSFRYEKDADNIVLVTIDLPDRSINVIDDVFLSGLQDVLDRLSQEDSLAGVVFVSGKPRTFIAGGDIAMLQQLVNAADAFRMAEDMKAQLRQIETLGKPVVMAVNGNALGGGLEFILAGHYRVALDDPRSRFGFPEVGLGLLPGGGGVTRLTRLLGLQSAFPMLVEGKRIDVQSALQAGIVDALDEDMDDLLGQARTWALANPAACQPWDVKGYRMPGGDPSKPQVAQMISVAPAMLLQNTHGSYPAPEAILSAMVEGAQVDFDTASRIESRYFAKLVTGQISKNMINAFWFQMNEINNGRSRPEDIPSQDVRRVGVLGAGLMGHGIAYVSTMAGMEVVLKDADLAKAEAGKARIQTLLAERVTKGKLDEGAMQAALARVHVTDSVDDFAGCDLVIEAVFEDRSLKGRITREVEALLSDDAVFASNTSTLPITGLAEHSGRPHNFVGLHFFSPVHKMNLVEIIRGEQTSDRALALAFDYVLKIRKTPIVVNDSRGFFTSRVFTTYIFEGLAMLAEGLHPRAIESAGLAAGLPVGPLAVLDEVNLGLVRSIRAQTRRDYEAAGSDLPHHPADDVLDKMVGEQNRPGKAQGAGFYDYPQDAKKHLWGGLRELFPPAEKPVPQQDMVDRMMFIQAIEAVRCLDEGVVTSTADANIGSIYGWGFAPFKGGVVQYINDYGLAAFINRCGELSEWYGERFTPPDTLLRMQEAGEVFP